MVMGADLNPNGCKAGSMTWWFDRYGVLQEGMIDKIRYDGTLTAIIISHGFKNEVKLNRCFTTKEACLADERKHAEGRKAEYKRSISDAEDLIRFLLQHDSCRQKSGSAQDAARERAAELFPSI